MLVINNNKDIEDLSKSYIALGSFDGIHIGHLQLIKSCIELANRNNGKSMVYTFANHPLTVINPLRAPKLLMNNNTKLDVLEKIGVDIACLVNFDKTMMKLKPEEFIIELLEKYSMKGIVVGFNYRFGYRNTGNVELLEALSKKYNFELKVIEPLGYEHDLVSSSRIRTLIIKGHIEQANKMLYSPFKITGVVISGKQLGRKLGYPTANMSLDESFVIPKIGIYYTNVIVRNKIYKGMTNVGYNPTVENTKSIKIETYILDFNEYIYDEEIHVYFSERIRNEIKFSDLDGLISQMKNDYDVIKDKKLFI